ncbi:MAG: NADH-quinone oxidoreductase subunit F [Arcobacteraceae bacterium]
MNTNKIQIENSDAIITIGTRISVDNPKVKTYIDNAVAKGKCEFIYMHPIDDISLQNKYTQYIKYEAGSEEGVVALLASYVVKNLSLKHKEYIEDLDVGYLSGESSIGEEEFELLAENLATKSKITLIIGEDIYAHSSFKNIANIIRLIAENSNINIILLDKEKRIDLSKEIILDDVSDIKAYHGTVIYILNADEDILKGSASFATAAKIKDNDMVNITYDSQTVKKQFKIDSNIRGTIALYPISDNAQGDKIVSGYRFKQVQIQKVNS